MSTTLAPLVDVEKHATAARLADAELDERLEKTKKRLATLKAERAKRNQLDDDALHTANDTLDEAWRKTHCIGDSFPLVVCICITLAVAALTTFFLCVVIGTDGQAPWTHWGACIALPWVALAFVGLMHLRVCTRQGSCGSSRSYPCSK